MENRKIWKKAVCEDRLSRSSEYQQMKSEYEQAQKKFEQSSNNTYSDFLNLESKLKPLRKLKSKICKREYY